MILGLYRDWERGIHPVSTGRAAWLTDAYVQAMHEAGLILAEAETEAAGRMSARRGVR